MLPLCTQHPETSATLATVDLDPGRLDQSRLIDKPYCGDGISVSPKRGRYYDFERQAEGTYKSIECTWTVSKKPALRISLRTARSVRQVATLKAPHRQRLRRHSKNTA